jgi:hypothetical protein
VEDNTDTGIRQQAIILLELWQMVPRRLKYRFQNHIKKRCTPLVVPIDVPGKDVPKENTTLDVTQVREY